MSHAANNWVRVLGSIGAGDAGGRTGLISPRITPWCGRIWRICSKDEGGGALHNFYDRGHIADKRQLTSVSGA